MSQVLDWEKRKELSQRALERGVQVADQLNAMAAQHAPVQKGVIDRLAFYYAVSRHLRGLTPEQFSQQWKIRETLVAVRGFSRAENMRRFLYRLPYSLEIPENAPATPEAEAWKHFKSGEDVSEVFNNHKTVCSCCGYALTNPASQAAGAGPICGAGLCKRRTQTVKA